MNLLSFNQKLDFKIKGSSFHTAVALYCLMLGNVSQQLTFLYMKKTNPKT